MDKNTNTKTDPNTDLVNDSCYGCRKCAKSVLRSRARELRQEADNLDALAGALPEVFNGPPEEALWNLLIRSNRK